jgi:hypothetical protein
VLALGLYIMVNDLFEVNKDPSSVTHVVYSAVVVVGTKMIKTVFGVATSFCCGFEAFVIHRATNDDVGEYRSLQKL